MRAAYGPVRASLASPPALRALLVLALPALAALAVPPPPQQPQHQTYILCKKPNSQLCLAWPTSAQFKDVDGSWSTSKKPGICGRTEWKAHAPLQKYYTIERSADDGPIKVFCSIVILNNGDFDWRAVKSHRVRRQIGITPRGRYRGQTQSQYLAIDRGGKDEGKAEAHSAADSSRASVSGNSGMGQAQSQSMYDPTCDDCYGRSDPAAASLKKGPYGSIQTGNGGYGHDQNAGPGWTGLSGNRGIPGTGIYGKDQNGSPGLGGYGPAQTGVQNFGKPGAGNFYEPGKASGVDLTPGRNGGYGPSGSSQRIGPGLVGSRDTLQPDRTGKAGGLGSTVGYVPDQQGSEGYGPSRGSGQGGDTRPNGNAFGGNYGPTQSGVSGGYAPGQGSSPESKNYVPGSLTNAPGSTGSSPEQLGTFGGDGSLRPNQVGSPGGIYSQTQPIGTYGPGQNGAFLPGPGNALNRSPGNFISGMQGPNGGMYIPPPDGTPNGLTGAGPGVIRVPQGGAVTNLGVAPIGGYNPDQIASGGKQLSPSQVGNWPQGTYTGSGSPNYLCCVVGPDGNLIPTGASVYNRGPGVSGQYPQINGPYGYEREGIVSGNNRPLSGQVYGPTQSIGPDQNVGRSNTLGKQEFGFGPGGPANGINRGTSYYQGGPTNTGNYGGGNYETKPAPGPGGGTIYGSGHQPVAGGSFVPGQGVGSGDSRSYSPGQVGTASGGSYVPGQDGRTNIGANYRPALVDVPAGHAGYGTFHSGGPTDGRTYIPNQDRLGSVETFQPQPGVLSGTPFKIGPGSSIGPSGGRYAPGVGTNTGSYNPGQITLPARSGFGLGGVPDSSINYGQSPGGGPGSASGYGQGGGPGSGRGFGQSSEPGIGSSYGQGSASGYGQGVAPGSGSGFGQSSGSGSGNSYGQGSGPGSSGSYEQSSGGGLGSASGYGQGGGPRTGSGFGQSNGPGSGSGFGQNGGPIGSSGFGQGNGPGSGSGLGQGGGLGSSGSYGQSPSGGLGSASGFGQGGGPGSSGNYGQSPGGGLGSASGYGQNGVPGSSQGGGPSSGSSFGQGAGPGSIGSYGPSQGIGPGHAPGIGDRSYGLGPGSASGNIGNYAPGQNTGPSGGVGNYGLNGVGSLSPGQGSNLGGGSGYRPNQGSGPRGDGVYRPGQAVIGVTGNRGPSQGTGPGDSGNYGSGVSPGEGSRLNNGQPLYGTETNKYGGNVPVGIEYDQRFPGQNNGYNTVPQNFTDPNTLADGDDSEAEAIVSQAVNGTTASASSRGGNDKGRAQTNVQGTYTGSGSFTAQALITGENKEAESEVTGGKKGASSSAQGSGRNNKSQANVQLGSETGSVQTQSLTNGAYHSSNSQVQGSIKGGMADAQARGPGSTSSQAQIGFTPYKDGDKAHDLQKIPFVGGGVASAQSSGRTGQSQSQLHGTFKYGISYNGAAQAGASVDKDAVFPNRLSFDKIDVFDENEKNINVDTEKSTDIDASTSEPSLESVPSEESLPSDDEVPTERSVTEPGEENKKSDESLKNSESRYSTHTHLDHHRINGEAVSSPAPVGETRSFQSSYGNNGAEYEYTTDREDVPPDEYDTDGTEVEQGEYSNYDEITRDTLTHQSLQSPRKTLDVRQTTGGSTQHIVLGSLNNQNAEITQRNSERPDESKTYQPGERVPGTGGYTIPAGFTGSVKSVASKEKTYVVGSKESPSQAQTVTLTPGTGKVRYTYPSSYGRHVDPGKLRSLHPKPHSNPYVTLSKSVTRDLDAENNVRKQYSHSYYTKSSSCGFFTFTCTMVSGAEGRKKVCRPKIPTNPDGSPIRC